MKTFLKIDYYAQLIVFFGYIIFGILHGLIIKDTFLVWFNFYFVVGGFQLVSYSIKILMGFWTDLFIKFYGIMILPIWFILLLEKFHITIDILSFIPFYGLLTSPFMAFFYLFYCRDKSKNPLVKL